MSNPQSWRRSKTAREGASPADPGPSALTGDATTEPSDDYDPDAHTVDDVIAHLRHHPDQTDRVLDLERSGKARVSILNHPPRESNDASRS